MSAKAAFLHQKGADESFVCPFVSLQLFSFGQLVEQLLELFELFFALVAVHRLPYTALHVREQDIVIRPAKNGLRGHELVGDVETVAVLLHHFENTVQLPARGFEKPADGRVIRLHGA